MQLKRPLSVAELTHRLEAYPRVRYGPLPTPLEPLPRLSQKVGKPQLWIKRDDEFGPGLGGNKGRMLEFLMAEVMAKGVRKVTTFGDLQSNHMRMTAAACAQAGLDAHLFVFARRPEQLQGNLFLDRLCGARLHFVPFGGGAGNALTLGMTNRLVRWLAFLVAGPGSYFIPVGGHSVIGCLGYVAAAAEIQAQIEARGLPPTKTTIVTAAGTGGTLAGLAAGFALLQSPVGVLGLDTEKLWKGFSASVAQLAEELCATLGRDHEFGPEQIPLLEAPHAAPASRFLSPATRRAIIVLAQTEGILLDPIFTGKAFAGLLDLIDQGAFVAGDHIIFLHTGGLPGLWAYADELATGN